MFCPLSFCQLERKESFVSETYQSMDCCHSYMKFPKHFSSMARDFFSKLCVYPATRRYDASTALSHPWITREETQIPMTIKQEVQMFETERNIKESSPCPGEYKVPLEEAGAS